MNEYNPPTIMQTQRKGFSFAQVVGILFVLATFFTDTVITTVGQYSFTVSYDGIDKDPITKEGILKALSFKTLTDTGTWLIRQVQRRGVAFQMDPSDEQQIRKAGSHLIAKTLDDLIEAIRTNFRPLQETPVEIKSPLPSSETQCLVDNLEPSNQITFDKLHGSYELKVANTTYRGHFKDAAIYKGKDIVGPRDLARNVPSFYYEGNGPEKLDGGDGLGQVTVALRRAFRYPPFGPLPYGYGEARLTIHIPAESAFTLEIVITDYKLLKCK